MSKKNKKKEYQKKAERRQRQFDQCHGEKASAKAYEKKSQVVKEKTYVACVTQWEETSFLCGMGKLSHYEFSLSQLKGIMKWKPVNLSECHQEGSAKFSTNYKTDYECVVAALHAFINNPLADTAAMFLDADPSKSDEQIEAEWRMGIKTSGSLIECVNHAIVKPNRFEQAHDYSCSMGCPFIEIDLPKAVIEELKRAA